MFGAVGGLEKIIFTVDCEVQVPLVIVQRNW